MTDVSHASLVAHNFGSRSAEYVTSAVHAAGPDLKFLGTLLIPHANARLLDIGCGGGHVSYLAAQHVQQVTAYDLSADMLAAVATTAKERGLGNIVTQQGIAESLPFADASFDIVASRYSAHHWHDVALAMREAHRVVKPGGLVVFIDVAAPGLPIADTHLQTVELLRDSSHVRDYSPAEWLDFLGGAGFIVTEMRRYPLLLEFTSWVARMATPPHFCTAIRELQKVAPSNVSAYFAIQPDGSFTTETIVLVATRS